MNPAIDLPRLRATLGAPELGRLVSALRRRVELGRPLDGRLELSKATAAERSAVDALLGRRSTRGESLQVDLGELADVLQRAGICEDLSSALLMLQGPVVNRRAAAEQYGAEWSVIADTGREVFATPPPLAGWWEELLVSGVFKRLCGDDAARGAPILYDLERVVRALPVRAEPLAALAARVLGDAHALDPGSPRATLAVRAAARLGRVEFDDTAEGRRAAWASVGVMCDELSVPALVFNLPAAGATPLSQLLRTAAQAAEPLHVSLRLLLRYPLSGDPALAGTEIFVCENPTVVALAAAAFARSSGNRSAPLVCLNGQFATPSLILLRQLRDAGARLRYHGDFDPGGVAIARRVFQESGAVPWRYSVDDYIAAPKGRKFIGKTAATPWSPLLAVEMAQTGRVVHEEAVFAELALDLARCAPA